MKVIKLKTSHARRRPDYRLALRFQNSQLLPALPVDGLMLHRCVHSRGGASRLRYCYIEVAMPRKDVGRSLPILKLAKL